MLDSRLLVTADRLVDGRGGAPVPDAGVLVDRDGSIAWVGRLTEVPEVSDDCRRVDVAGGTLLPGFVDTHVHFALPGGGLNLAEMLTQPAPVRVLRIAEAMRATLHAGVTTVRDLGFLGPSLATIATSGAVPAPRLLNAVSMVSSTGGHGDFPLPAGLDATDLLRMLDIRFTVADGADQATQAVRELIRDGADVIKVAATGGISTPADGPDDVGFTLAEMRAVVDTAKSRGKHVAAHALGTRGIAIAVEAGVRSVEHGTGLTAALAERMAEQGTFLVPTLVVLDQTGDAEKMGQDVYEKGIRWREAARTMVPMAAAAGVPIATGTDAGLGIHHGQNLRELTHLVDVGLSPMDAIVAGTRTAADACGLADQIGTIEVGKRADLVVAAGNPLDDVGLLAYPDNIVFVARDGHPVKQPV